MRKILILLVLLTALVSADSELDSGLAVGERAPAHNPIHVTGPDAGTTVCPV